MIGNDVLKAVLAESKAEFVQASIWTLSDRDNSFVRRWQIDRSQAQEAEEFLRKYLSAANYPNDGRTITNPVATTVREGVYRGGRVMAKLEIDPQSKTEEWFIYQELRKGLANTTLLGGSVDFSAWRVQNAESFRSDSNTVVLELPNVDPSAEQAILGELTADTFSSLSTINESLSGTWHNIKATAKMEDDGSYSILLFLSKHNNSDLYFKFQAGPDTIKGFYYKWEATETTLAELIVTKQFDADGDIVTSAGKTLQEVVSGRTVQMRRTVRDPEDRLFDVEIEITWTAAYSLAVAASSIVFQKFEGASVAIDQGFGIPDSLLPNYSANYNAAALNENQLGNFQFERDQENGTFRFTGSITTLTARQGYIDCGDKWVFFGGQTASNSLIDVPAAINGGVALAFSSFRTTALAGFKSDGSVSASTETGLFAYNIQVQKNGVTVSTKPFTISGADAGGYAGVYRRNAALDYPGGGDAAYSNGSYIAFVLGRSVYLGEGVTYESTDGGVSFVDSDGHPVDITANSTQQIEQRWTENGKGPVLPVDILSSYDDVYGLWYELVDFKFDGVAGNYTWQKTTTRYCAPSSGSWVDFSPTVAPEKKDVVFNRSFQPSKYRNRGNWKEEAVAWNSLWEYDAATTYSTGHVIYYSGLLYKALRETINDTPDVSTSDWEATTDAPTYWVSMGYQALYGNWQSWFVKASYASVGDDFGSFIGRLGTGSIRYTPDRFGQKSLHWNYKTLDRGTIGWGPNEYTFSEDRDLSYTYIIPSYGFSIYDHEVLLLKKYRVRREYIRWCEEFNGYSIGDDHEGETPPVWVSGGFEARYGAWKAEYVKASATAGDDAGALVGINSSISVNRYQPTPQNIGLNWSIPTSQSGTIGWGPNEYTNSEDRDLNYTYAVHAYGFSVYDHPLVEAPVLTASGEPEVDMDTGVQYSAVPYENPAFCVLGQRLVRYAKSQVSRYYMTVNPALVSVSQIPTMATVQAEADSNRNVSYKPVKLSEYLWAVEKTVTEFTEWKADLHEVDSDGNVRNWPKVDQAGFYFLRHVPTEGNSFTGEDVSTGKVAYPPTIFD